MSVIATRTKTLSDLLKRIDTDNVDLLKDTVQIKLGAGANLQQGVVLGKITATGFYIPSIKTAVDGSQVPSAIYLSDKIGDSGVVAYTTAQTPALALTRGKAVYDKSALILDASWTGFEQTVYDAFAALGLKAGTEI